MPKQPQHRAREASIPSMPALIAAIAKKEIVVNLKTFKTQCAGAVMAILLLLSGFLLASDYKQRLKNWSINQEAQQDQIVGGIVRYDLSDGSFFHSGGTGHSPPVQAPRATSSLVKGIDGEVDRSASVRQQIIFGARQDEADVLAIFNTPDTSFIIKLLISLFGLVFAVGAITREKEDGTLRALLAHPVNRATIVAGKAVGASVSLLVPFAIAYLIEIGYLAAGRGLLRSKDEMLRASLVFALGALYGIVFVLISLFISTMATKTRMAVVSALLVWGTIVLVLPNAAVLISNLVSPVPSYNNISARLRESREQILQAELRAHPGAKSLPDLPNAREVLLHTFNEDRRLMDQYLDRKLSQMDQAQMLAQLSPAGALSFGQSNLAGTGARDYRSYVEFLRSQRDEVIDALKRQFELPPEEGTRLVQEALRRTANGQRQPEPLASSLASSAGPFLSLALWGMFFAIASYWRFQNYDVR